MIDTSTASLLVLRLRRARPEWSPADVARTVTLIELQGRSAPPFIDGDPKVTITTYAYDRLCAHWPASEVDRYYEVAGAADISTRAKETP